MKETNTRKKILEKLSASQHCYMTAEQKTSTQRGFGDVNCLKKISSWWCGMNCF